MLAFSARGTSPTDPKLALRLLELESEAIARSCPTDKAEKKQFHQELKAKGKTLVMETFIDAVSSGLTTFTISEEDLKDTMKGVPYDLRSDVWKEVEDYLED